MLIRPCIRSFPSHGFLPCSNLEWVLCSPLNCSGTHAHAEPTYTHAGRHCDRWCSREESLAMTVTCGPMGVSVVRDWDVTEEDYYCDPLNYSSMKELNTQSERARERENFGLTWSIAVTCPSIMWISHKLKEQWIRSLSRHFVKWLLMSLI